MCEEFKKLLTTCWPGIFGALVSVYYTKPLCLMKGLISFFGGAVAAVALAPMLASMAGYTNEHTVSGISFLVGTFSMSVLGITFQVIDRIRAAPIRTLGDFLYVLIDVLLAFRHGRTRGERGSSEN